MIWQTQAVTPSVTRHLRSLLRLCARDSSLDTGKKLHASIVVTGLASSSNSFLHNALLHLYSACGITGDARKVFDQIPQTHRDTIDWSTLMCCFARNGEPGDALYLFKEMVNDGTMPDDLTMVCVLNACAKLGDCTVGIQGHDYVVKMGFDSSVKTCNAVMDMYAKCGLLREARRVFDEMSERSVVSWTVILDCVIRLEGLKRGRLVFDEMPEKNEVAWTVMIVGYVGSGFTREAFALLADMVFSWGLGLNHVTICSILSGCAQSGDVTIGGWVHVYSLKTMGKEMNIMVSTSLVDMYAKCGRINTASKVFHYMPERNVIAWNSMLSGLAMHGRGRDILDMFHLMSKEAKPDDLTFTCILNACSHSGLVDQGRQFFRELEPVYGAKPKIEHYACMVDLLGRAGLLEEAENLIREMPMPPNEVVLGSLLGSCSVNGKIHMAERTLQELVQVDPHNTEYHILLSNMYNVAGRKDKSMFLRQVLKTRGIKKVPGMSSIHVRGQIHQFVAGDKSHPQTQDIYVMLDEMIQRLRLAGYVPNTTFQVFSGGDGADNSIDEQEEKEQAVFSHSEKLALCFGLISTSSGSPLYIFKNLRTCQDCHAAIKIASEVYNREIVVRDRNRFHYFRQGSCSCSDYW